MLFVFYSGLSDLCSINKRQKNMFSLFTSSKPSVKKNYLLSLIKLAKADGFISDQELELLIKMGKKHGVSQAEVLELISDADEFFYKAPVSDADRFDQLYDMVEMMMADGRVEESEKKYIIDVAEKMGVRPAVAWILITNLMEGIKANTKKKFLRKSAANYLFM